VRVAADVAIASSVGFSVSGLFKSPWGPVHRTLSCCTGQGFLKRLETKNPTQLAAAAENWEVKVGKGGGGMEEVKPFPPYNYL